jgi:hypothetical protein
MERLIDVRIFIFFACGLFCRFGSSFAFTAFFVIGLVPALALEPERALGNDLLGFAMAMDALGDGLGGDALQGFKGFPALQAPVFIDRHSISSEYFHIS